MHPINPQILIDAVRTSWARTAMGSQVEPFHLMERMIGLTSGTTPFQSQQTRGQLTITGWRGIEPTGSNQLLITIITVPAMPTQLMPSASGTYMEKSFCQYAKIICHYGRFHSMPQLDSTCIFWIVLDSSNDTISLFFNGSLSSQSTFDGSEDLGKSTLEFWISSMEQREVNFSRADWMNSVSTIVLFQLEISTLYSLKLFKPCPTNINSIIPLSMAESADW